MKRTMLSCTILVGALGSAEPVNAQPPDIVVTDDQGNTAMGTLALDELTSGQFNTAGGGGALYANGTGSFNAAWGYHALYANGTGFSNVATGFEALAANTTGYRNTATGEGALTANTGGGNNTATGTNALGTSSEGNNNTASGSYALATNSTGSHNTADGTSAMYSNTNGEKNVALGELALSNNTTGSSNIAIGMNAGLRLTTGWNNIDLGSEGASGDNGKIRIGTPGTQTATFVAGINDAKVTGAAVYVTSSGQLGVLASAERYKTSIAPMGAATRKLARLRPVTFHLKTDPSGAVQYGLVAEQVAQVFPELVIRGADGRVEGVRYDELAPMLLNEFLALRRSLDIQQRLTEQVVRDHAQMERQSLELRELGRQIAREHRVIDAAPGPAAPDVGAAGRRD